MSGPAKVGTSSPNYSNTDVVYLRVNTDGALLTTSTDMAGTASTDKGSFTEGTTKGTPAMGAYLDTLAALTPGVVAIQRLTSYRAGHVNLRNASGVEIGTVAAPISQAAADGSSVALGATTDAAVFTDAVGTLNAHVRGLVKLLAAVTSLGSSWIQVSIQNATLAVTQSGLWVLSAGSALIGKVGIDQTTPGTTNKVSIGTDGTVAVSGTVPVTQSGLWGIWGLGRTTLPSSVASAAQVQVLLDRYGRTYVVAPVLSVASSAGTAITTNTNTSLVAAPSAGNHLRIHRLWAQNSSATGTWCYWGNGSGVKTLPFFVAQNQPFSMAVNGQWELSTATGLFMNTATTGANVEWFVAYETLAD